jgi:hypothetical protein
MQQSTIFKLEARSQAEIALKLPQILNNIREHQNDQVIQDHVSNLLFIEFTNDSDEDHAYLEIKDIPANTEILFFYDSKLPYDLPFKCRFVFFGVQKIRGLYVRTAGKYPCESLIESPTEDMTIEKFNCQMKFMTRNVWIETYLSGRQYKNSVPLLLC